LYEVGALCADTREEKLRNATALIIQIAEIPAICSRLKTTSCLAIRHLMARLTHLLIAYNGSPHRSPLQLFEPSQRMLLDDCAAAGHQIGPMLMPPNIGVNTLLDVIGAPNWKE
jgi:hypothetical protein